MSMKDHPTNGYVLEASKVVDAFFPEDRQEARLLLDDGDWEGFQKHCEKLPANFPRPVETFLFGDEDSSEELEKGELYCRWEEDQLYKKVASPGLVVIRGILNITPEQKSWAMWG
jgi:hypothetical protein